MSSSVDRVPRAAVAALTLTVGLTLGVSLGLVATASPLGAAGAPSALPHATPHQEPQAPDRCADRPGTQQQPCVGPVVDESGGGGDTLTIVLSVVVGLAVAGIAFVLLRRQLATESPRSSHARSGAPDDPTESTETTETTDPTETTETRGRA